MGKGGGSNTLMWLSVLLLGGGLLYVKRCDWLGICGNKSATEDAPKILPVPAGKKLATLTDSQKRLAGA